MIVVQWEGHRDSGPVSTFPVPSSDSHSVPGSLLGTADPIVGKTVSAPALLGQALEPPGPRWDTGSIPPGLRGCGQVPALPSLPFCKVGIIVVVTCQVVGSI